MTDKEAVYTIDLLLFIHLHCLMAVERAEQSDPYDDTADLMLRSIEHLHNHIVELHKLQNLPTMPSDESLKDIARLSERADKMAEEQTHLHIVPNPDKGNN